MAAEHTQFACARAESDGHRRDDSFETRFHHTMARLRIPAGAFVLIKEVARHLLRRPVVGIAAAARTADGRWLLIRRADVGDWALPGGTLEWGETLRTSIVRELAEEAGVERCTVGRVVGVYSRPDRDPRMHGVTIVVECSVDAPTRQPDNPLEIIEARLFSPSELPATLAMGMRDMLDAALRGGETVLE
jgi:8-oxo-dGTP diphosphatase